MAVALPLSDKASRRGHHRDPYAKVLQSDLEMSPGAPPPDDRSVMNPITPPRTAG